LSKKRQSKKAPPLGKSLSTDLVALPKELLQDVRRLILQARERTAQAVNATLVLLYWQIGTRIHKDTLKEKRADYGEAIVPTLSAQLTVEFGQGFAEKSLRRMIQFAAVFPDSQIVAALSRQLTWSHFVEIIPIHDGPKRDFYAEMCRLERWSVRTLREKIGGMLFERTALSKKPDKLIQKELTALRDQDKLTPELVFRDPYFLDFLGLKDTYSESDLEAAILRQMEAFLLELGAGFTFAARQKRMVIDNEDFYLDLLFYHRKLHRLIALDLKLEKFKAADKGQMELYLRWLDKHEREVGEETPLGLILCASKSDEQIELLQLDQSGIHVASYLTELPPRKLLEEKLHMAVQNARAQLDLSSIPSAAQTTPAPAARARPR
jgi:predicted nuclease of restriction endonuclease-like (RecB) superfamily